MIHYEVDDKKLDVSSFLAFVNQVWPGNYDIEKNKNCAIKNNQYLCL